jgi:hypothetical protein|tara:strand:- start:133 stop:345 length:213 start_codon:yes stop_codon:yes gene_type:complete
MYELEFIPKRKVDNFGELVDSTWLPHESSELTQELLDFIENEFENDISEFETVVVYYEGCYNLPIKIINL